MTSSEMDAPNIFSFQSHRMGEIKVQSDFVNSSTIQAFLIFISCIHEI